MLYNLFSLYSATTYVYRMNANNTLNTVTGTPAYYEVDASIVLSSHHHVNANTLIGTTTLFLGHSLHMSYAAMSP